MKGKGTVKILPGKVRSLRERALLSRQELADRVGVSMFAAGRWERGDEPVSVLLKSARLLHEALGAGPGELLADEDSGPLGPPRAEDASLELATMLYGKSPADRIKVLRQASRAEVARYLADIDKMVAWAGGELATEEGQQEGNKEPLQRYMRHMLDLRNEAAPDNGPVPTEAELALVGSDASVGVGA